MRAPVTEPRLREFMRAIAAAAAAPGRIYLTGGATVMELFEKIEDHLYRFPAVNPAGLRAAVAELQYPRS